MEIVITIIVIIFLIGLIKALFAFIAENWKPILIIIGVLALIALIIVCIIVPEQMYGAIVALGGVLIIGGVVSTIIAFVHIANNIAVDRFYKIVFKCADFLLGLIQDNSAMSDTEIEDEIKKSPYYNFEHMRYAIIHLINNKSVIKEKLKKNEFLYINNTPKGEQMEVIEISLD